MLEHEHPGRVRGLRLKPELPAFFPCFNIVLILRETDTPSLVFKAPAFSEFFPSSRFFYFSFAWFLSNPKSQIGDKEDTGEKIGPVREKKKIT